MRSHVFTCVYLLRSGPYPILTTANNAKDDPIWHQTLVEQAVLLTATFLVRP